jgi:dehydrogenase/reductase SDR family member 7B
VVIVTGASSGIGAACAQEFDAQGAHIVLAARTADKLQQIAQQLTNPCWVVEADVAKEADCQRLVNETIAKFGKIDVLVNNAGITMRALFNDAGLDVIRRLMDINFWGTVYCTKFALPHLLKTKGSVVGVSSIAGFKGLPGRTGYSASKFAMQGFLEALRIENHKTGLHVLIACPGYTASNIRNAGLNKDGQAQGESPLDEKKLMSPEEVATHIARATTKRKKYLVLTPLGKLTVWLNRFFPSYIDGMVYNSVAKEKDSPFK